MAQPKGNKGCSAIPEAYREVLTLHYFGGMNSVDIARALGTSPAAAWDHQAQCDAASGNGKKWGIPGKDSAENLSGNEVQL